MARKKIEGICHICGTFGPLTFEHIPPEKAFNDEKVRTPKFEDYMDKGPDYQPIHAPIQQKGAGGHTLCAKCNNLTGAKYVPSYIDFAYQAADLLFRSNGELSLFYPYRLFPLRFIKQVIAIFCSVNSPNFVKQHPELIKFLLHEETKYLRPDLNIYAYLTSSSFSRQSGISAAMIDNKVRLFSEFAFPPLGFILTIDSYPPDNRLVDISYFARYDYNFFDIFHLKLPVLPTQFYLPGDFRTKEQIMKDYERNIAAFDQQC